MDSFKKWFDGQSNIIKFVLLILPFVGWVVEILLRWNEVLKNASVLNIVLALVYTFVGWAWILGLVDAILVLLGNKMLLID